MAEFEIQSVVYDSLEGEACEKPARPDFFPDDPNAGVAGTTYEVEFEVSPTSGGAAEGRYFDSWTFVFDDIIEPADS